MAKCKVVFLGGGSYQWGIGISRDLLVKKDLDGSELVLLDLNLPAARDIKRGIDRLQAKAGTHWKVSITDERRKAFKNADFVILCISTGALDSMQYDVDIPWRYGIHQPVGDSIGPGGLNRALRNIPVYVDICRDILDICPHAWVLNLSNPMTTLTRATERLMGTGKVVGLCHEVYGTPHHVRFYSGISDTLELVTAGINHCLWLVEARHKGRDIYPRLREAAQDKELVRKHYRTLNAPAPDKSWSDRMMPKSVAAELNTRFENDWNGDCIRRELLRTTGYLPVAGNRHTCEFFGHFTQDPDHFRKYWHGHFTTIEERRTGWLPNMIAHTMGIVNGTRELDLNPSCEPVAPIIDAMVNGKTWYMPAGNMGNRGQITNLPLNANVETPCVVTSAGVNPVTVGPLPPSLHAALAGHVTRQEMIVEAALTADRDMILAALISDPLVQDASTAGKMLDEMMNATRPWLPQFFGRKVRRKTRGSMS
jgi:alpha-galactosidase